MEKIQENEWYEFVLNTEEKYIGKCLGESFLNIKGVYEARFSCHKDDEKKGYFYDFSVPLSEIKSIKKIKEVVEFIEK